MDDMEEAHYEPTADELAALATFMPSFTTTAESKAVDVEEEDDGEREGDEFEYKLFSQPQRVSIREVPDQIEYACPVRPMTYYLHTPSRHHLCNIAKSAISGAQVRHQGLAEQWCSSDARVQHVPFVPEREKRARWRPSKARRVRFAQLRDEQRRRAEIRASVRHRGTGTRGRGGSRVAPSRATNNATDAVTRPKPGGYPRKGPPAV